MIGHIFESVKHGAGRRAAGTFLLLAFVGTAPVWAQSPVAKTPPETRTDNVREVLHGVEVVDRYRWLEDSGSPETRAWINAENEYTHSILDSLPGRESLKQRLTELLRVESLLTPTERNGRYFFLKRRADQDLRVLYLRQGLTGRDEVLIDPHPMSADHTVSISLEDVSADGTLLVYGIRQGGADEVELHIFDVNARRDLPDRLPKARYFTVSIARDKSRLYYTRMTPEGPRVYVHAVGADPGRDTMVFGEGYDPGKIIIAELSEDGRYLLITVLHGSAADRTEVYAQDLARPGPIVPIVTDLSARFFVHGVGEQLFLHTNWNAPKGRILAVDLKNPGRDRWREIIPESSGVIEAFALTGGKIMVQFTENASSRLKVFEPSGGPGRDVALPAIGSVFEISGRWESREAFFYFSSFHMPPTIYRCDLRDSSEEVWARVKVPVDTTQFEVKQVWYESKDGTRVPMFLVHRKGLKLDGSNPALLTGYGGFTVSETPVFSASAVVWIEHGGVYAVPNLRGGGEFGEEWHRAGMLGKKQNVFDDFIAAAEWLVKNDYTSPAKLAITGGSNGGLLVGAALTQRPDLFGAVACLYPLLDMLRYHKFLVARFWVPEYGSADDPAQFKFLYAYSPYHHVKPGKRYPATLFVSGDADTRVDPLHARKMAALLQAANTGDRPILLRYDTRAGHVGGARPVSKQIEDSTDILSFLLWQVGATPASN